MIGATIAATSVLGLWALDAVHTAMNYKLSDWIFFPIFFGVVIIYPVSCMVVFYERVARLRVAICFALGFGLGWYMTMEVTQAIEFGIWKGFRLAERTPVKLLLRQVERVFVEVGISLAAGLIVWSLCRFFRGRVLVRDGTLCEECGYNLTGNVSGICPECGTKLSKAVQGEGAPNG